jgi:hypothetical protein
MARERPSSTTAVQSQHNEVTKPHLVRCVFVPASAGLVSRGEMRGRLGPEPIQKMRRAALDACDAPPV